MVGERHLIGWKVAFEHAPVRAKLLNAERHEGRHGRGQLVRADRRGPFMPVKPQAGHADAPQLQIDIGHAATAARPRRQVDSTSSSRWAYGPTRVKPPKWFRIMVSVGTACANAASSGNWGKQSPVSRDSPMRASA